MKKYCKNKNWEINKEYNVDKLLYLLIDRPNHIIFYNDFVWKNKKEQFHRNYDLPAVVHCDGYIEWRRNHKLHRKKNKPAVYTLKHNICYYINGKFIKKYKIII